MLHYFGKCPVCFLHTSCPMNKSCITRIFKKNICKCLRASATSVGKMTQTFPEDPNVRSPTFFISDFFSPGATTPIGDCILQPSSGL